MISSQLSVYMRNVLLCLKGKLQILIPQNSQDQYNEMEPDTNTISERVPLRVPYNINRKVYNEEEFEQEHDQKMYSQLNKESESPKPGRKIQCRFSRARFRKFILKMFPILNWLYTYRITEWILGDIHAGLNVGIVQVFQGLSGIALTGLPIPVINNFYSAFCCSLIYVIFGTSQHMSIGSFSILNAMAANFQSSLNFRIKLPINGSLVNVSDETFMQNYMEAVTHTASTTFLVGIIQLLLGIIGLGFVTTYVSESLMNAYLTAAALHVIISQFSFIFGIVIDFHAGPLSFFYNLVYYCMGLPKANSTSILLFLLSLLLLRVSKCIKITYKHYPIEFPMELVLIIVFTMLSTQTHLHAESSQGVFTVTPHKFLKPTLPVFSKLDKLILHASSLAIVSYFLLIFVGKKYASIHNYHIRHTQDLIAIGLCNVFSSFFKTFSVSCAISTTVIQEKTGGKTQLAALIGISLMLVTGLKLGYYFQSLPNAVLAAIVLVNMFPFLEKFMDVPYLWKQDKYDFGIWIVTFLVVLCLGLDIGLGVSLGFAFFIISVRAHRMKMMTLGQIPNTNIYRRFSDYSEAIEIQGVKIFQCCASISFANMKHFKKYILKKMDMKAVPLDENEMRALISISMSSVKGQSKDLNCACICDPPEPIPRVPYREKLLKRVHTANESFSASSLALVRWTRDPSDIQYFQSPARERAYSFAKRETDLNKMWFSSDPRLTRSTTQLYTLDSEYAMHRIHTIILDFSMVHFVDLQASCLLRELCHIFQNIGISILIAACHSTVIKTFENRDFFDQCVTKARFFPTLHDAILFAVEPTLSEDIVPVETQNAAPEDMMAEVHLDDEKDIRSYHSGRSKQSERRSQQSNGIRDAATPKTVPSETYIEEPISDLFRTFSLQSDLEGTSHHPIETSPLEDNEDDQEWEGKWNYSRDV
ncbi:testis anion transporter 1 [Protobothrops mucrosquamatus]|uniref:testis anion transporter 1 n=1 Tax=Protobothrops mucrosquamatus TaxID=103944 RepID=UPI0010FB4C4A|nr:testis anion transporter 1 [Protobothrops mucrosquamatus]